MMYVLGVDPGTLTTAWVLYDPSTSTVLGHGQGENEDIRSAMIERAFSPTYPYMTVFEQIESFGKPVGSEVFETVFWTGRFAEVSTTWARLPRTEIKKHLCLDRRAKDQHIRRVLLDRFGGDAAGRKGGRLAGVKTHEWAALAVAVSYADMFAGSLLTTGY